jgi:cbb3-type cytochrome oxidase subunit 1
MITSRLRILLTVGRLEYSALVFIALAGIAARHAHVNEWFVLAAVLFLALTVRRARNRGVLNCLVERGKTSSRKRED